MKLPGFWQSHFLAIETVVVSVAAVGLTIWSERFDGRMTLELLIHGHRGEVYILIASTATGLLGFLLTVVAVLQTLLARPVFERLKASNQNRTMWSVFIRAVRALSLTLIVSFIGLLVDRDGAPAWPVTYITMWSLFLTAILVGRSIWVIERIITVDAEN